MPLAAVAGLIVSSAPVRSASTRPQAVGLAAASPLARDSRLKRGHEFWSRQLQFGAMRKGQLSQKLFSAKSELQQDFAAVCLPARTPDEAFGLKTVCEFNRAVMLNLKPLGQNTDSRNLTWGQSLDRQQSLMLMRLDSCGARSRFAKIQKAADFVAKISER
jgi:hypothetical protein